MDLFSKNLPKKPGELLAEAKVRGAVMIDDEVPGQGFEEDFTDDPSYNDPAVLDLEKRMQDAGKPAAQVDELTKAYIESNTNAVRKYRFSFQEEYTDWVPGRVLRIENFLGMLQRIRPDAFVSDHQVMGLRGLGFVQNGAPCYSGTSVQDIAPEWSQLRIDARGLPTREKYRGWRTVLLACIKGKFITEQQCDSVFGKPNGPRSRPWYRQLYSIRNGTCGECHKQFCDCGFSLAWDSLRADNYSYSVPDEIAQGKRQELYESRIYVP